MSNPQFPVLTLTNGGQDSKKYEVELEDPAMKSQMDGGYVVSRAKHTRPPRKTFTTGYTGISDADRETLQQFWNTVRGGSIIFDWTDPVSQEVYAVRFTEPMRFKYAGVGETRLWDCQIKLEQA